MIVKIIDSESLAFLKDKKTIETCLNKYQHYPQNNWIQEACGKDPFINTKYDSVKDIVLNMSSKAPQDTDFENVKEVYSKLDFLSDSNASDERLWAAMCLSVGYEYTRYRWKIETYENVVQHYYFAYGGRRSLTRNAMSRLWWIGRLTYDKDRKDPWELTRFVCQHSDYVMHLIERNTSNSIHILRPFLEAIIEAQERGIDLNTDDAGELSKYLNLLGGVYILDFMSEEWIKEKIGKKIDSIIAREHEKAMLKQAENIDNTLTRASSESVIIVQENETSPKIPLPVKKNKFRTEPKSLVGVGVGDTVRIGKKKYIVVGIK